MVTFKQIALTIGLLGAVATTSFAAEPMIMARNPTKTIESFATSHKTSKPHSELFKRLENMKPEHAESLNNSGKPKQAVAYLAPTMNFIFQPVVNNRPRYSTTELKETLNDTQRLKLAFGLNEYGRGFFKQGSNKLAYAEAQYKRGIEVKPTTDLHMNLGLLYWNLKKHNQSIKQYQSVLKLKPNHQRANYSLGGLFFKTGNFKKSLEHFTKSKNSGYKTSKCNQCIKYLSSQID